MNTISKIIIATLVLLSAITGTCTAVTENWTIGYDNFTETPMFEHDISPNEFEKIDVTNPQSKTVIDDLYTEDGKLVIYPDDIDCFEVWSPNEKYVIDRPDFTMFKLRKYENGYDFIKQVVVHGDRSYHGAFSPDSSMLAVADIKNDPLESNDEDDYPERGSMNDCYAVYILDTETGNIISEIPIEVMSNPNTIEEAIPKEGSLINYKDKHVNIPSIYWTADGNQIIYDYLETNGIRNGEANRHTTALNINYEKLTEIKDKPLDYFNNPEKYQDTSEPISDPISETPNTVEEPVNKEENEEENEAPKAGIPFSGLIMGILGIIGASYLSKDRNK
jgi:hypothetical protein